MLRDVWRAGLSVTNLWPRTTMRELLHVYRVPALHGTNPAAAAAFLTSQPSRTTTDFRPVSSDSTDTSLGSQPPLKITSRSFLQRGNNTGTDGFVLLT